MFVEQKLLSKIHQDTFHDQKNTFTNFCCWEYSEIRQIWVWRWVSLLFSDPFDEVFSWKIEDFPMSVKCFWTQQATWRRPREKNPLSSTFEVGGTKQNKQSFHEKSKKLWLWMRITYITLPQWKNAVWIYSIFTLKILKSSCFIVFFQLSPTKGTTKTQPDVASLQFLLMASINFDLIGMNLFLAEPIWGRIPVQQLSLIQGSLYYQPKQSTTWMSQKVSKWLVSGLYTQYTPFISIL